MKLSKILTTVGATALNSYIPGAGSLVASTINAFLPEDKQISESMTGKEIQSHVNKHLNPGQWSVLMEKELDIEVEEIHGFTERFKAAQDADKTGNSTRPQIALMMARTVCFTIIVFITGIGVAIVQKNAEMATQISNMWVVMGTILGVPSVLLRAYFGLRTKEKHARYQMANNQQVTTASGMLASIMSAFRK